MKKADNEVLGNRSFGWIFLDFWGQRYQENIWDEEDFWDEKRNVDKFHKSCLERMAMKRMHWSKGIDYLVPRIAGIFIWVATVSNFLEQDAEGRL